MTPLARLAQRLTVALGIGRGSTAADGGSPIQTLQLLFQGSGEKRERVPFMQHYGFGSRPKAGCDYVVVSLGGDGTKSVIVASNDKRYRVAFEEGECAIFDDQGQKVHLQRGGITVLDKSQNSIVTSSTGILVTDKSGSTLTMADEGIALAPANKVVTVVGQLAAKGDGAGTGATVDGNLNVTGGIHATDDIVAGFGTVGAVSLLGHKHLMVAGATETGTPEPLA